MICVCNIFIVLSLKASYLRSSAAESRKVVVVSSDKKIKIFQFVELSHFQYLYAVYIH